MALAVIRSIIIPWLRVCLVIMLLGATSIVFGQEFQLSREQQRMLDQLPPSQRQQALDALAQMRAQQSTENSGTSISEPVTQTAPLDPDEEDAESAPETELLAEARSRLVIGMSPRLILTADELEELIDDPVLSQMQGSRFYVLDESAVLTLPGLAEIPLMGLNGEEIKQRLTAEPELSAFDITAVLLNSQPIGVAALEPFGYDLFEDNENGFEPPMAGPVPPDYVLGPGDVVRVQLFGNVNAIYEYEVSRDGVLNLPELGPVTVSGLPFSEFRSDLKNRVDEMLIGTKVSVTMGQLRTVRVFVLGDANRPGSYVVNSLATISSALYRSGGLSEIGSMRNIALKRRGRTVATLDLYDLLLKGDTSGDLRVQPGDVIFVPPIGNTVSVSGAVRRPAIYEVVPKTTVADVIRLAGGFDSEAYPEAARVERIDPDKGRIVLSVNAEAAAGKAMPVINGDTLIVPTVLSEFSDAVVLNGYVQRPGPYQWRPGMRLTDFLPSALDLTPGADINYVLIRRESETDRSVQVVSADLGAAIRNPGSADNIELQSNDSVQVFGLEFGRQRIIAPILDELRLQSQFGSPFNEVTVGGQVRAPGSYPLEPRMRISHLIRAGGSMSEGAYAHDAELTRNVVIDGEYRVRETIDVDLEAILAGDSTADLVLDAHDHLSISLIPAWNSNWSVTLDGEVKFPGEYQILQGETLSQLLERAGGFTEHAFPQGAIFLREALKEREREQMDILATRMEANLTAMSAESLDATGEEALLTGNSLLVQLQNAEPVGRLVIDLARIASLANGSVSAAEDIELRDGDQFLVPVVSQEVSVIGEVLQATSHLHQPGLSRDDYARLSGGPTRRADKKLIYVVRANGAVIAGKRSKWFGRGRDLEVYPGDTVVVPLHVDIIRPLEFWGGLTQIIYQSAIALSAIDRFTD